MQPYFFPYLGYFQLLAAVDRFIVYDNIKYTKKGWINRNRMLRDGRIVTFTLPLMQGSDALNIEDRCLADGFNPTGLINQFTGAYRQAPFFDPTMQVIREAIGIEERNLFRFLLHSIKIICGYLDIQPKFKTSSAVTIDHSLKSQEKVLAICAAEQADHYFNVIGGRALYSPGAFATQGVKLSFLRSLPFEYEQSEGEFVPAMSIVDVMMFNPVERIKEHIFNGYELV